MARAPFAFVVIDASGNVKSGVSVEIRRRSDNALASIFSVESGGAAGANPMATDASGRALGFVERGSYKATFSGGSPAITQYTENFEAAPAGDATFDAAWASAGVLPLGSMMAYAGSADPAGGNWLLCDGRALARTGTYAALFAAIGTAFGAGDGSTTFNIPNTQSRTIVGAGTGSGLSARARGATGGSESEPINVANLPPHGHPVTINDPGHFHGALNAGQGLVQGGGTNAGLQVGGASYATNDTNTKQTGITASAGNTGSGTQLPNMQPWLAANYIIRAV